MTSECCVHDSHQVCRFCGDEMCSSCRIVSHTSSSPVELRNEYECKLCSIQREHEVMSDAILAGTGPIQREDTFDMNIVRIIAAYSVGYVVR